MRRTHLKILCLSLLALGSVLAASASPAQAKWSPLRNKFLTTTVNVNVELPTAELLVPELGIAIHCDFANNAWIYAELNGGSTTLEGFTFADFHSCSDLNFGEVCNVSSVGFLSGDIQLSDFGDFTMAGEKVFFSTAGFELGNIVYSGEECPLVEIDGRVRGSMSFEFSNPLADSTSKTATLVKQELSFGESPAEFHDGDVLPGPIAGTATDWDGSTWALHLVGL